MRRQIDRLLETLAAARGLPDAAPLLTDIGRWLGLERAAAVENFTAEGLCFSRKAGLLGELFGWPPVNASGGDTEPLGETCPIGRACRLNSLPFVWRASQIGQAPLMWDNGAREFWRAAAAQGLAGGVTIPVHLPLSRVGAVGWMTMDGSIDLDETLARWGARLRLAALLFMDHIQRARPPERAPPNPSLSARELQCLTWVALGKTDIEIGELIGRSPATARFHIESAVDKLAVNNRARAAAVASQMGMIRALA